MTYDANFDQNRLDQLANQHLKNSKATGKIMFFSESEDNRLDHASWQFTDDDYAAMKESDFKLHLMELLDILLIYRNQYTQPNSSQGVVHVHGNRLSIEWLTKEQAEDFLKD